MSLRTFIARRSRPLSLAAFCVALASCDAADRLRTLGSEPKTPHDRYADALEKAGLNKTVLGRDWVVAGDSALRAPHDVSLPFKETGIFNRSEVRAVTYRISLAAGQRLTLAVRVEGRSLQLFVDLFRETGDSTRPLAHEKSASGDVSADSSRAPRNDTTMTFSLEHEAHDEGQFIVRIQPELLRDGRYRVEGTVGPILAFPVQGRDQRAVQSFFGANRDAGRRSHQGIDIFAPRGTPVIAATAGIVRSTAPNALGGNVVWLSDPARSQTLYYAHLDRQSVVEGQRVQLGDTLGFVGNTGNARTTPPHLHFGIYRRGEGPVDPYPWVRRVIATAPALTADTTRLGQGVRTTPRATALLNGPTARGDTIRRLEQDTPAQIVGAAGAFYRVELSDGVSGYLAARATRRAARDAVDGSAGASTQRPTP
jgi:peptidoglycan LD-endopeptidase LytH